MLQHLQGTGVVQDGNGRDAVQPCLAEGVSDHGGHGFGHYPLVPELLVEVVAQERGVIVAVPAQAADADETRGTLPGNGPAGARILFPIGLQNPDHFPRVQRIRQGDHVTKARHLGVRVDGEDLRPVLGPDLAQDQAIGSKNGKRFHVQ